jgi:hypothetical protein
MSSRAPAPYLLTPSNAIGVTGFSPRAGVLRTTLLLDLQAGVLAQQGLNPLLQHLEVRAPAEHDERARPRRRYLPAFE